MANHIVNIGVADRNASMRFALHSGLVVAIVLAATAVTASSFTACAQDPPSPRPIAQVITSTGASPATGPAAVARRAFSRAGEDRRLFFGFLEFDWDPNTPSGVPGFGLWPDPAQAANR
jgi:hypothetical protein